MNQLQFKSIVEQILDRTVNEGQLGEFKMRGEQFASDSLKSIEIILKLDVDNYDRYSIENLIKNYDKLDKIKFNTTLKKRTKLELNDTLIDACWNNDIEVVKLLLANDRINPGVQDNQAIIYACQNNYIEIVKLLLADKRVNPSVRKNQAIIDASWQDDIEVVELLKEWYIKNKKKMPRGFT